MSIETGLPRVKTFEVDSSRGNDLLTNFDMFTQRLDNCEKKSINKMEELVNSNCMYMYLQKETSI